jgi:hypothetical protein
MYIGKCILGRVFITRTYTTTFVRQPDNNKSNVCFAECYTSIPLPSTHERRLPLFYTCEQVRQLRLLLLLLLKQPPSLS